eukprot:CAMPEP_0168584368 /NCGR_PEP_ID=MMETSP0420-20121227/3099_1 /TAXON_ID=498008 /ORGANISM="Pessonella sp." /LENGTH=927 /DNA_ID=CAMNT_0008619159 /DNA_START=9 /DNA_END=2788 /DNA_ORIENTATION=+
MFKISISLLLFCLMTGLTFAQTPKLVKDINPGSASSIIKIERSYPEESKFANVQGRLFFACDDGTGKGEELCTSDGNAAGTSLIKDVNPGPNGAFGRDNEPRAGIEVNGKYLFRALVNGNDQLWVSGGCDKNTYNVRIINNGNANIRTFRSSSQVPGQAFFFASELGPQADELWQSDGTPEGTKMAVDACKDPGCGGATGADDIGFLNGKVYFSASSTAPSGANSGSNQLWQYDPATGVGRQFKQLRAGMGSPDGYARGFAQLGNDLMFVANDGTALLNRLWKLDGSTASVVSSSVDGIVPPLVASGTKVFFQAKDPTYGNELHVGDATMAKLVKDLIVGNPHGWAEEITSMGSFVLFSGDKELYRSDGSAAGTTLVKDINAGGNTGASPGQSYPRHFVRVAGNLMAFSGDDARNGRELWVSDGTESGTRMLADINKGGDSDPQDFTLIGSTLFFSADDGVHGRELWKVEFGFPNGPPPAVNCPAQQIETPTNTDGLPGACCAPNACMSATLSQCAAFKGNFLGVNTNCGSHGAQCAQQPPEGACCKGSQGTCAIGHTPTSCAADGGRFIAGQPCSYQLCLQTPSPTSAPPPSSPGSTPGTQTGVCCAGSGGTRTCYKRHTATSCAGVTGGEFKLGDDCQALCYGAGSTSAPNFGACTEKQQVVCSAGCPNGAVDTCVCTGGRVSVSCRDGPAPSPVPPTGPAPTPVPPGHTVAPFPVTGPGGKTFTQVQAPFTNNQGQPITQSPGVPATVVKVPQTDAQGNVPTGANGNPLGTVVVQPKTDSQMNVDTMGGTTGTSVATQSTAPSVSPSPPPSYAPDCQPAQMVSCAMQCSPNTVLSCSCSGGNPVPVCNQGQPVATPPTNSSPSSDGCTEQQKAACASYCSETALKLCQCVGGGLMTECYMPGEPIPGQPVSNSSVLSAGLALIV